MLLKTCGIGISCQILLNQVRIKPLSRIEKKFFAENPSKFINRFTNPSTNRFPKKIVMKNAFAGFCFCCGGILLVYK